MVPGWQVVIASRDNGLSYDVPPSWKNNGPGVTVGLDDGTGVPQTTVTYSALAKRGSCDLAGAGFRSSNVNPIDAAARQAASMWARSAAYGTTSPRTVIGPPQPIHLTGLRQASEITVRVTNDPRADNCGSTGTTVRIVALPVRGSGSLLFVLWTNGGLPGAVSDADAARIVDSVRLAP